MAKTVEELLQTLINQQKEQGPSLGLNSNASDFAKALKVGKEDITNFGNAISNNLNVWRDLSKTGAAFSNDVVGMSVAAAQSRMRLDEFAQVIKENGKFMTGLGGSVGRGAEVFSKLSKSFFDSNMDRGLRELGYTSKELNDVLALTAGAQKSAFQDTEAGQKRANQAAAAMAKEMDMIAKLTGKSRQEQMEEMTKRKVDGQVESKLRMLTAGKTDEEAAKIRNEYQKGLLEAQKQGVEQSYKEFFATGTYLSEGAATQRALFGKQIQAQEDQIKAIQRGDAAGALEARQRQDAENLKNQSNKTLLTLGTLGDAAGPAGAAMTRSVEINDALFHSVSKVKNEYEAQTGKLISWGEALALTRKKIEAESAGRDKEGKAVSGATEGLLAFEKAQQDLKAGIAGAAVAVDKEGKSLANALRDTGTVIRNVIENISGGPKGNIGVNIEQRAQLGMQNATPEVRPGAGKLEQEEAQRQASGGIIGAATKAANEGAKALIDAAASILEEFTGPNNPIGPVGGAPLQRRATGGPVDANTPYLVGEGGQPEIFVPKTAGDIVPMDKIGQGGVDITKISKDISTSISSVGGGSTTTRRVQSEESKAAEKELQTIKNNYAEERRALSSKFKEMMPNASIGDRRRAMNASDESKALNEKYDSLMKPLEKKIEEGIKWEVEKRTEQTSEIKQQVTEELEFIKLKNTERLNEQESEEDARIDIIRKKAAEERNEILKKADLHKDVIGKSVKDLSDEAIEKLLPAGTVLEDFYQDIDGNLQSWANDSAKKLQEVMKNEKLIAEIEAEEKGTVSISDIVKFKDKGMSQADAQAAAEKLAEQRAAIEKTRGVAVDDKGKLNLNKLNIPGVNFGSIAAPSDPNKPSTATQGTTNAAETLKKEEAAKKAKEELRKREIAERNSAETTGASKTDKPSTSKSATLDDVVKSLDMLNMKMGQLINQQSDLVKRQTSAMIASTSSNIYDRTR